MKVRDQQPRPHVKYMVRRDGMYFTAVPCYGMSGPWWVVSLVLPADLEADPVEMQDDDEWWPLEEFDEMIRQAFVDAVSVKREG